MKLAVGQWNNAGGVDGRKVQLSLFDDQGDPTVGTELARKISSQGFVAMFGTAESAVTLAMAPILRSEHIPNITSGQSTELLALHSPYLFLNGPTGLTYDSTLAKYLVTTKGYKKIAMLTNNDSYGAGEESSFRSSLSSLGVKPVAVGGRASGPDQHGPRADGHPLEEPAGPFHRRGRSPVWADRQAGACARYDRGHRRGGTRRNAALPEHRWHSQRGRDHRELALPQQRLDAATRKFAAAYQAAYGSAPELHGAKAYDGAEIMLTALRTVTTAPG